MKIQYLIVLFALLASTDNYTMSDEPTKLFLGNIQLPTNITSDLCLYYKGQKLPTKQETKETNVQFSFLESKYAQEVYIVICDALLCKANDNNTIQHLEVNNDQYTCYKLQASRLTDEDDNIQCSWSINQQKLPNNIIPDHALIFLFNPHLIEGLHVHQWKSDNSMRILPTIKLKNIPSKELTRIMSIKRLSAMDIDALHSKPIDQGTL